MMTSLPLAYESYTNGTFLLPLAYPLMLDYNLSAAFKNKCRGAATMLTKEEMPACPVATTVSLIGSKWKLLILRNLLVRPWRFNELKKDLNGISQKVLTDSLRSMEADGLIIRTVFPEVPPHVEYSLSELGESMRPVIDSMEQWGLAYKQQLAESEDAATID